MASVILGDWTHRRGDAGGARAVAAEIERPRPVVAWSWRPDHRGRVDQVRIASNGVVVVATMAPRDPGAPGWEHAVVYLLDAQTGVEIARRVLPDPVPVAAMVIETEYIRIVATRKREPIFGYQLSTADLVPRHRTIWTLADSVRHDDVLDAWACADGGMWLELDVTAEGQSARSHAYALAGSLDAAGAPMIARQNNPYVAADGQRLPHDACASGNDLFVPAAPPSAVASEGASPSLVCLEGAGQSGGDEVRWARSGLFGAHAKIHALAFEGLVYTATIAEDTSRPGRARVEVVAFDRDSGSVRWRASDDRIALRSRLGDGARLVRRPSGELLFQSLGVDDVPCSPLLCAGSDGRIAAILLGARGYFVLDAALGSLVLAHREDNHARVEVSGFAIDGEGRLLGRRAVPKWSIDAGDLGGSATVYAGAGLVVVRGTSAVSGVRL